MDLSTITGLIIAIIAIIAGIFLSGGNISSYLQLASAVIVLGGTFGATMMCFPFKESITVLSKSLINAFKKENIDTKKTVGTIISLASIARKDGLLALEKKLKNLDDKFFKKGLQLAIDGVDSNKIIEIMEADLDELENRHMKAVNWMSTAGGYAPTFGIIGTVLGLIIALAKMDSPEQLGEAVAAAFLTTLYGIASANLFFVPISKKLKINSDREIREKRLMAKGVLSIQSGANPRMVKEELSAFLKEEKKKEKKAKNKK